MFVKPANLGSSVGISKAKSAPELIAAMDLAGSFDRKIVVEAAVPDAREIECAVLGNDAPEASVPGEIVPSREFYDYEAKYLDDGSKIDHSRATSAAQPPPNPALSIAAFKAIDCAGMARVDFLLEPTTAASTSTRSTPSPGSRPSACIRSSGRRAASATRRCSIG